jgi:hypothetical protein
MGQLKVNSITDEAGTGPVEFPLMPEVNGNPVIERGSNANGEFVKYADGTMICTRVETGLDTATYDFRSKNTAATFINSTYVTNAMAGSVAFGGLDDRKIVVCTTPDSAAANPSTNRFPRIVANTIGSTNVESLQVIAIGRWF